MKIILLSDINSAHTQKWAIAISQNNFEVAIFSISKPTHNWYSKHTILLLSESEVDNKKINSSLISKLTYIKILPSLKKAIKTYKPDIIHAHYATSYGLLGALSDFHPFIISAWGSDVMEFPDKNIFNKKILKYNFKKSDSILATSSVIAKAISTFTNKTIHQIPFGIDTDHFKPSEITNLLFPKEAIVIGTLKALEDIYGIDILIRAFKKVIEDNNNKTLKLLIVGGGSRELEYKTLVDELNITNDVVFIGKVEYDKVVDYHNMIDIFVNVSRNESFGVAVLEASACGKPVIVSNVGGLSEVVIDENTGFLVESENINATKEAIEKLIINNTLRNQMGTNGRIFVQKNFNFTNNVKDTLSIYKRLIINS